MTQQRRLELATRRGELTAHIAAQRANFAVHTRPLVRLLGTADQAVHGVRWLKKNPQVVFAFVAGLAIMRPRRVWRWAKRGLFLWRSWKTLRSQLT